ncbi:carbohydrate binding domain-containing protein [Paenibacillus cymbidii]|uniref:carbohydrate binding domain-containing protein n=1 Tax=Paenibacillus cymbidii TaxID=1639034 RepID=UPI0010807A4B|nr:carbohydrate binding domain-containing protein [Paenibacillus cymbidii]
MEQQVDAYEPNTPYMVSYLGKRYGAVGYRAQAYDYTTGTIPGQAYFTNTAWTRHEFGFTTPAAGHDVRIRVYNLSASPAGQSIAFDNVHAYPALAGTQLANAGFETADRWDATLPRYWKRGATTLAANAVLDTADRSAGLGSLKLVSAGSGSLQELIYTWKGYMPGAGYTFSFDGKVAGAAGGRVQIVDTSTSAVLVDETVSSTAWTTVSASFTAPASHDHTLQVILQPNDPAVSDMFQVDQLQLISQ